MSIRDHAQRYAQRCSPDFTADHANESQTGGRANKTAGIHKILILLVGTTGVEPARISPKDPKSFASANSATRPLKPHAFLRPAWEEGKVDLVRCESSATVAEPTEATRGATPADITRRANQRFKLTKVRDWRKQGI